MFLRYRSLQFGWRIEQEFHLQVFQRETNMCKQNMCIQYLYMMDIDGYYNDIVYVGLYSCLSMCFQDLMISFQCLGKIQSRWCYRYGRSFLSHVLLELDLPWNFNFQHSSTCRVTLYPACCRRFWQKCKKRCWDGWQRINVTGHPEMQTWQIYPEMFLGTKEASSDSSLWWWNDGTIQVLRCLVLTHVTRYRGRLNPCKLKARDLTIWWPASSFLY